MRESPQKSRTSHFLPTPKPTSIGPLARAGWAISEASKIAAWILGGLLLLPILLVVGVIVSMKINRHGGSSVDD